MHGTMAAPHSPPPAGGSSAQLRLQGIAAARQALLAERRGASPAWVPGWVERSWQRCLAQGLQPEKEASFATLSRPQMLRTLDANAHLVRTARPLIESLGRAIVNTGYFAILTNHEGVVVDVSGAIDRSDPRADLITRIGTDLSEHSVGTTAIGTALTELQPVWLHRGEHFFTNTAVYSCAGAPVLGPDGRCAGMLDLTGIEVAERPELKHLVTQVAGKIENALVLSQAHSLTLRLNWPGTPLGGDGDGILCLDADGHITGANPIARQMVPGLASGPAHVPVHASAVFGVATDLLFDAAQRQSPMDVPLWNGLMLQCLALDRAFEAQPARMAPRLGAGGAAQRAVPLKDLEAEMIQRAVQQARGNVAQAAQALGLSRATVYRKLQRK